MNERKKPLMLEDMTLRDALAMQALAGDLSRSDSMNLATICMKPRKERDMILRNRSLAYYRMANAMLAAREEES